MQNKGHTDQAVFKWKRGIILVGILGLMSVILAVIVYAGFYIIKEEKNLEEALLTFGFLFIAVLLFIVKFTLPLFGLIMTRIFRKSKLLSETKKVKSITCIMLYTLFGGWLLLSISIVIKNIIMY